MRIFFRNTFLDKPTQVETHTWINSNHISLKAPTCVLIKKVNVETESETVAQTGNERTKETQSDEPELIARAFGYEAESDYASEPNKDNLYLFKRFKMLLDVQCGLDKNVIINDVQGKPLPAISVFSLSIKWLMKGVRSMINDRVGAAIEIKRDILWVLTVPAIWNDCAKQFMREAAVLAGIPESQLVIALEAEAASIFCRFLPNTEFIGEYVNLAKFDKGTQYMVLDAGGGTVDITIHEIVDESTVREVEVTSGGPWGGVTVDQEYFDFFERIIGCGILAEVRKLSYEDEMIISDTFEILKRKISPDLAKPIRFRLPVLILSDATSNLFGESLAERLEKSEHRDKMKLTRDHLTVDVDIFKKFFKPAIDKIIRHVVDLLSKPSVANCKHIVMVGGFSESKMLQAAIRETFPDYKVIIPAEAGLAVLKGAVIFGHDRAVISHRVCRYNYGTNIVRPFIPREHPETKRDTSSSFYCSDVFLPLVQKGDCLTIDQPSKPIVLTPCFTFSSASEMYVNIYASKEVTPTFVTDAGCNKIGMVTVPMPETGKRKRVEVCLILGGTEMQVRCRYVETGEITTGSINFLG